MPTRNLHVVGIDVGGSAKGYHAVALTNGKYSGRKSTGHVNELVEWCRGVAMATVIAVDAPCRWSMDGHARPAEMQLMRKGVWCFATPTRHRAIEHPKKHFEWMRQGELLFRALETTHSLCSALPAPGQQCCFETFPHAITWHLRGNNANAKIKRTQRKALLEEHGIELAELTNIDLVDAALCALTAHTAASAGECQIYGESETGLIIVPATPKEMTAKER